MQKAGRLGDKSRVPVDSHGCPSCPHSSEGPAVAGSPNVEINTCAALRVGDSGVHSACCGANTWKAVTGAPGVFINGKAAHRLGDRDQHCGGMGQLVEGSPNVFIGDRHEDRRHVPNRSRSWLHIKLLQKDGAPAPNEAYVVRTQEDGLVHKHLDENGEAILDGIEPGTCEVTFPNLAHEELSKQ